MPYLERNIHPIVIIAAFKQALEDAIEIVDKISIPVNVNDPKEMLDLVKTSIGTKFVSRWSDMMCKLALDAVRCVAVEVDGRREVDIKRYARVEKVLLLLLLVFFHRSVGDNCFVLFFLVWFVSF